MPCAELAVINCGFSGWFGRSPPAFVSNTNVLQRLLPPQLGEGRGGARFGFVQLPGDKRRAVIPNLFRNRKIEVDKHSPCDPETSSG